MKKILAMLLVVAMVLSMVACGSKTTPSTEAATTPVATDAPVAAEPVEYVSPYAGIEDYDELSEAIYMDVLGEFYEAYSKVAEAESLSERYALQALAEAKLMEAAVMLPIYSAGGNYAMNRKAPYTSSSVQWGYSEYRYNTALICAEPIAADDYIALKQMWAELAGTGTYLAAAKDFLVAEGYTLKNTYTFNDSVQPEIWDCLASSRATVGEYCALGWEGLVLYDAENVMQPALAESWEESEDGLTYTFHLRQGAKWVDAQGREIGEVTADDFVAGLQHMMDAQGGLEYLIEGIIKNASEYISGEVTDFAEVGVKAVDDYTVVYTLEQPASFFLSMLNYSLFAPLNRAYYESQGGKFGAEFDAGASTYKYGTTPSNIAYCGPYTVTNLTADSTMVFKANPSYWDAANTTVDTITVLYNDGTDVTKTVNDFIAGTVDGAGLTSATIEIAKAQALPEGYVSSTGASNWYDEYSYVADTNATSYMGFLNVNRSAMENVNDGACKSTKTEEDVVRSNAALQNVHFRRALCMSVDRGTYNAQSVGEELKFARLRNTYTPGNFVKTTEEVTVDINGTATTFPAFTLYGEIIQAQIDADGVALVCYDPAANDGMGSTDGFDGWYNVDNAVAELKVAVEELAAQGIEVSTANPILIDYPVYVSSSTYLNKGNALKQSMEAALGGLVKVNIVECVSSDEWYYTGYYTNYGYEANYELYDLSGWGPDYGDAQTYLDTMLPYYSGYMIKCLGIY